jgi:hypothetical protein
VEEVGGGVGARMGGAAGGVGFPVILTWMVEPLADLRTLDSAPMAATRVFWERNLGCPRLV